MPWADQNRGFAFAGTQVTKKVGVRQPSTQAVDQQVRLNSGLLGKHYRFPDQRKPDAHNRLIDNLCSLPRAHSPMRVIMASPPGLEVLPYRQDRASPSAGA